MNPPAPKLDVLLVEDNLGDARLMRHFLMEGAPEAFELEHVETLFAAIERLAKSGIGLILLDLSLPDSVGLETFAAVQRAAPQAPIIVLSGRDDESLAMQTVHAGAQDYLVKGQVDSRLLVRSMRYALERKRAEEALAHERDLFHTLLENLPDRIYFKDEKSRFMRISRAVARQFKLDDPLQAVGKTDFDFFAREHAEAALQDEQNVMRSGYGILGKIEKETLPDGTVTWALTSKMPLKDKDGRIIGNFGISRDITPLKRIEDQLEAERNLLQKANAELAQSKADLEKVLADLRRSHEELKAAQFQLIEAEKLQSVGRLAAGVAHEVKNPLAILRMGVDYVSQNITSPDENLAQILADMTDALKRADSIILGLLDFSLPGALKLHPEDINTVLEQSVTLVRHDMSNAEIKLCRQLSVDLPPLRLDKNKLKQALINILTNAIHAMPTGGTLTIRTFTREVQLGEIGHDAGSRSADRFRPGETVVVAEVEDTGSGISTEQMAKVFDPFFTTKPAGKGAGLGLTVTRKIIELHGGTIDIRNSAAGGAIVAITLKA